MVHAGPLQGPQPVVLLAIELDDLGAGLQQLDRGLELGALQAVLVEIVGMLVGRRHQGDIALEHPGEQAAHEHCIADIGDVKLIQSLQEGELSDREVNPFHFAEPVAPLVAARRLGRRVRLGDVTDAIERAAGRGEFLIVEGSGGLLVPLGEDFTLADLISRFNGSTIVVARNRLGTLNHTMLTCEALRKRSCHRFCVVLMGQGRTDATSRTNAEMLEQMLAPAPLISLGYLGKNATRCSEVQRAAKKIKKTLARICGFAIFTARSSKGLQKQQNEETEKRKKRSLTVDALKSKTDGALNE
jgi:dethiobiotin synthetase